MLLEIMDEASQSSHSYYRKRVSGAHYCAEFLPVFATILHSLYHVLNNWKAKSSATRFPKPRIKVVSLRPDSNVLTFCSHGLKD